MIDAHDELLAPSATQIRRRTSSLKSSRNGRSKPAATAVKKKAKALPVPRTFSNAKVKPFDQLEWDRRTAEIADDNGKVIFKQDNVEVPKSWSVLATKVVVSKYFYGEQNTPERETSVKQLVHRVCRTIRSEEHTSELQSPCNLVCRLLLEKKKTTIK